MKTDHEILSTIIDGELGESEPRTLQSIAADEGARATWARYHLIGDVLRDNLTDVAPLHFSEQLRMEIEREPTILALQRVSRPWLKPVAGFAIAASVAAIAVIGVQQNGITPSLGGPAEPVAESSAPAPTSPPRTAIPGTTAQIAESQEPLSAVSGSLQTQRRLNGYLVKFNEQRSSLGVPGVNPYVRIVGFESE